MRAALLTEQAKPLELVDDLEIRDPRGGEVLVRVHNCGICHSDVSVVDGAVPGTLPIVLGHEAAGIVEQVGAGVTHLSAGDKVVLTPCPPCGTCYWCSRAEFSLCEQGMGVMTNTFPDGTTGLSRQGQNVFRGLNVAAFAEYTVTQSSGAVKIPEDTPLDVACVIGCAVQTGVGAVLNTARVETGATVLVMGLGGIGISIVQGARLAGAARIIVSDPVAERRDYASNFGATDILDPTQDDVVARAREITNGIGVDYAFDGAGNNALVQQCIQASRLGGTTVMVGASMDMSPLEIPLPALFLSQEKKVIGCLLGSCNSHRDVPKFLALWRKGALDLESMVTSRRPLADINAGLDDMRASRGLRTVLDF